MIKWIIQDVKRTLKTRKTFLLIAVLVLSIAYSLFSAANLRNQPMIDDYGRYDPSIESKINGFDAYTTIYKMANNFDYNCLFAHQVQQAEQGADYKGPDFSEVDADCTGFSAYLDLLKLTYYSEELGELESAKRENEAILVLLDIGTDGFVDYYENSNSEMQKSLDANIMDMKTAKAVKQYVKDNLRSKYPSFDLGAAQEKSATAFNERSIVMYETYVSLQSGYPTNVKAYITPSFFIANYFNDYFLLLVSISALLIFDSFYRDYRSGVFKTILSAPTRRFRYAVLKTISSTISILIVVFLPLLVTGIILYFMSGFDTANYPIYISKNAINSLEPVKEYSRIINEHKPPAFYSTYKNICSIAPVSKFSVDIAAASFGATADCISGFSFAGIDILSLSKYLMILIAYFILVLIFMASLNTLLSLVLNNQIINLLILGLTILSSIVLNKLLIGSVILTFIPLTFLSPAALLMGTVPYTFLNGLITLTVWTIALNVLNSYIIKRKDFDY